MKIDNWVFVVPGELSTYGKEVFDRLREERILGVLFDEGYFERQDKNLSLEEMREAQSRSPSILNILLNTHNPTLVESDQSEKRLTVGFEVNHKDPRFLAELAEEYRGTDKHRVTYEDKENLDKFSESRGFQYALLINDDLYDCEDDSELLIRGRLGWWLHQDKPFTVKTGENTMKKVYSFANKWNLYHDKLCRIGKQPSTKRTISIGLDVLESKPPIDVADSVEFIQSLIEFLKAPYNYVPENYTAILRTAAKYRRGDMPEHPSIMKAYEELKNPPFNKLRGIQDLLKENKLETYISNLMKPNC